MAMLFSIVAYEKETFGDSVFYPDNPKGRNQCLRRMTHISFWFEWSLIPANVILVIGGSFVSSGLAHASLAEIQDPSSIQKVRLGQTLRTIGQSLFLAAILAGYVALLSAIRRAGLCRKTRQALWWLLASAPFLVTRGIYGVISSADWSQSYYMPTNYGATGLVESVLLADYLMAVTTESIALVCLLRTIWLVTMPKHLFVPYDKRPKRSVEMGMSESV